MWATEGHSAHASFHEQPRNFNGGSLNTNLPQENVKSSCISVKPANGDVCERKDIFPPEPQLSEIGHLKGEHGEEIGNDTKPPSILDSLECSDTNQTYQPVPDEILCLIRRLCKEYNVKCPVWAQSPTNWREIRILGRGVTAIQEQLEKEAKTLYPEFKFVTRESGPLHTKQFRELTVQQRRADEHSDTWIPAARGKCQLILSGIDKTSCKPAPDRREYLITAAHCFLSETQCKRLVGSSDPTLIETIRNEANSEVFRTDNILEVADRHARERFNLLKPVMIAYRHYYRTVNRRTCEPGYRCVGGKCAADQQPSCPHMYMNDIAVFSINSDEAARFLSEIEQIEGVHFDAIIQLTADQIEAMIKERQRVYVNELECRLVPAFQPVEQAAESTYADHIAFNILPTASCRQQVMVRVSSGAILYNKEGSRKHAFAVFIGEIAKFPGMYQAVHLKPALRDIEMDYRHHVGDFQLFNFGNFPGPIPGAAVRP